jgi:N-acetylneuraminic acid mutarotase
MSRRLSIVPTIILFALVSAVSGCSRASNSTLVPHPGVAGNQEAPLSLGKWTNEAPLLKPQIAFGAGVINGILYAAGGLSHFGYNESTVEAYDPVTNTWTIKRSMPTARSELAAGVINGILYAVGGDDDNGNILSTVEAYDPSTDTWTTKAPMPTARVGLAGGIINGKFYAVGGVSSMCGSTELCNTVEAYDPSSDTWTTKAPMPTARWRLAAGVVNGILYAVGGCCDVNGVAIDTLEAYDPTTNTWTTKAPIPTARQLLSASDLQGNLYAIGGVDQNFVLLDTVEAYDPATDTWTAKAPMSAPRYGLATRVAGSRLYAVGGDDGRTYRKVEAFNPRKP